MVVGATRGRREGTVERKETPPIAVLQLRPNCSVSLSGGKERKEGHAKKK